MIFEKYLVPDLVLDSFQEITPELLASRGIRFILSDIDNTLVTYGDAVPTPDVLAFFAMLEKNGVRIGFLSNNHADRVDTFNRDLGYTAVADAGKPGTKKAKAAMEEMGAVPEDTMLIVKKFGGTSVGTPQRMKEVCKLITSDGQPKMVVLSAMSGTTNTLVEISDYLYKKNPEGANTIINRLEQKYIRHAQEIYNTEEWREKTIQFLHEEFDYLRSFTKIHFTSFEEKVILAQGEIMSTNMVTNYLLECGVKTVLLPALDIIRTDKNSEPDFNYIKDKSVTALKENPDYEIYITQGFICRNAYGEIDNLLRGGSDYTACLIGAAIQAEEIQICSVLLRCASTRPLL